MKKLIQKYYLKSKRNVLGLIILFVSAPIVSNLIPLMSQRMLDEGIIEKDIYVLTIASLITVILTVLKSLLSYLLSKLTNRINLNAVNELKKEVVS